jgi:NADPH:quinone reductase
MRAIVVESTGGPEQLQVREIPAPIPTAGELLVRVHAVTVNHADLMMRAGTYHTPVALPWVPGLGGAGVVEAVGPGVTAFAPGDAVALGMDNSHSYAELARIPASMAVRLPKGAGFPEASAVPINGITAAWCVRRLAQVAAGEHILILGGSGAVGHIAVQLARAAGAHVIATASPAKRDWIRSLGAEHVIDHDPKTLPARVKELTGGRGVEVSIDGIGGPSFAAALRSLAYGGRCVALANATLEDTVMNTRDFYPKNATIHGFQIRQRMAHGWDFRPDTGELLGMVAAGALQIHVGRRHALAEAPEAHYAIESRAATGHVVLEPQR